ncbi:hypothetical protein DPEC_G00164200 [Dallia pectoralis]|uniref:Uncharacterized protein n=1 Tax=Dallia pectoralis TaxID=75939 RepID=A0ACC2GH52_DALPE|nr:hypothetical protein DPEC_G00164200 [Dallia pectoralis]
MSPIRDIGVQLFVMIHIVYSEAPETIFKPEGGVTVIGYCFGVDYITFFRSIHGEVQLLGNSSSNAVPHSPPADLEGRISFFESFLGLEIEHLRQSDSGLYMWECWKDKALGNKHEQELLVCGMEMSPVEISNRPDVAIQLKCNVTGTSLEGKTIQWYLDMFPNYNRTLFMDTSVSLEPLQKELREVISVQDRGVSLIVSGSMLTDNFYCLVMDGPRCLSFQNFYIPYNDVTILYASVGEKVVLPCPSDKRSQDKRWETPVGNVNAESASPAISLSDNDNFSLVVHVLSENFTGEYKCVYASVPLAEYALVFCPSREHIVMQFSEGDNVVLECSQDKVESQRVQWYRRRPPEGAQLILDSKDQNVSVPADLKGRVALSKRNSSLHLFDLNNRDSGTFWCVILSFPDVYVDDYGDGDDDEQDNNSEADLGDNKWLNTDSCILKQVTLLTGKTVKQSRETDANTPVKPEPQPGAKNSHIDYFCM